MGPAAAAPPARRRGVGMGLAAQLDVAIRGAGVAISGVSIGDPGNKATWKVTPTNLQSAAQATIDAFNAADPAHEQAELDREIAAVFDNTRVIGAIVWAIIDTYSAPANLTKFNAAKTKIVTAYKDRPWVA